jgi:CheY-like chemotaxis protein
MAATKILVIDDSIAEIEVLRVALNEQGEEYELETLADGAAALTFVQEHRLGLRKPDPCVILLDLHLPKHDGVAVLRAIRAAPTMSHLKVVVLTGLASPWERAEIASLGTLLRQKPADLSEFMDLAQYIFAICRDSMSSAA